MKISYVVNGETRNIDLQAGESWDKFSSTPLNSLFAKVDNGNGKIDQLEIDALRRQMNIWNSDGKCTNLSKSEQKKLSSLNWAKIRKKVQAAENLYNNLIPASVSNGTKSANLRKHVYSVIEDNATTVFKTFNEKSNGRKTLVGAIMTERSLSMEERAEYAKYLVRTLAIDYKHQGKNVDDIAQNIYSEIDSLKNSSSLSDSTRLDNLVNNMLSAKKGRKVVSSSAQNRTQQKSGVTSHSSVISTGRRQSAAGGTTSNSVRTQTRTNTPVRTYSSALRTTGRSQISSSGLTNLQNAALNINGKIDRDFSQGTVGDCWLLAAIKGIAASDAGQKLLDDSINIQPDGNVRVTLKGVNKTYVYTPQQIRARQGLSKGDLDVKALEMAMQDYLKEHPQCGKNNLDGNYPYVAYQILTGKTGNNLFNFSWNEDYYYFRYGKDLFDNFNKTGHVAVVWHNGKGNYYCSSSNGRNQKLVGNHAYTVAGSDRRNVYLINPYDTSKTITVSKTEFKRFFDNINEFDM